MNEHLKQIQADVDMMNRTLNGDEVKTDPPSTDPPSIETDPPIDLEDEVKTDPPSTDLPDDDFKTDPPKTDAPTTDAPDDRDRIIEELREELSKKDEVKTDPPTTKAPIVIEDQDFFEDLDFEEVAENKDEFNKLLNKVYQKGVTDSTGMASGNVLQNVPQLINTITSLQEASKQFYTDNEDLVKYKKDVASTFETLMKNNPDKTYDELFEDVAIETRRKLRLPEFKKKTVDKNRSPKLPRKKGKPGRSTEKPKLDPVVSDIEEMNKTLNL